MFKAVNVSWVLVGLVASLGGCNSHDRATSTGGALTASPQAQRYGVGSYLVRADHVELVATGGEAIGLLELSTPSPETRLVTIHFNDGRTYEDEITNPQQGHFDAPLIGESREIALQTDPALAPFFASANVRFQIVEASPTATLAAQELASCTPMTWPALCYLTSCNSTQNYWSGGIHYTQVVGYADCPPVNCDSCSNDQVSKTRTCADPGTCTNVANGWTGLCTNGCGYNLHCCPGNLCAPLSYSCDGDVQ